MVGLDTLLVREAQLGGGLAAGLAEHEAVHAVPGHDGVSDEHKVDKGIFGQDLGVGRLRGDVGDAAVSPEDAVQGFLGQVGGGILVRGRHELDPNAAFGEAVEVLEPGTAPDQAGLDAQKGVKPGADGALGEGLGQRIFYLGGRDIAGVGKLDKGAAVFQAGDNLGDGDGNLVGDYPLHQAHGVKETSRLGFEPLMDLGNVTRGGPWPPEQDGGEFQGKEVWPSVIVSGQGEGRLTVEEEDGLVGACGDVSALLVVLEGAGAGAGALPSSGWQSGQVSGEGDESGSSAEASCHTKWRETMAAQGPRSEASLYHCIPSMFVGIGKFESTTLFPLRKKPIAGLEW